MLLSGINRSIAKQGCMNKPADHRHQEISPTHSDLCLKRFQLLRAPLLTLHDHDSRYQKPPRKYVISIVAGMPLFSLPNELLLTIADNLEARDINLFIQTNRRLAYLLTPYIRSLAGRLPYELGALFWAASSGNTEVAKILLSVARDITIEQIVDETVISYCEPAQKLDQSLRFVLEEGQFFFYDLDVEGKGLHWAVRNAHYSLARLMLDEEKCGVEVDKEIIYDITIDPYPETPLPYVCASGDVKMVQLLLSKGASVSAKDTHRNGRTPLHVAAAAGQIDVVRILLEKGADASSRDTDGQTAIDYAGWCGHNDIARLLLEKVDFNFWDSRQQPLLHLAIRYSHEELVRRLIHQGAPIHRRDDNKMTALHHAAKEGNEAIVKFLLENGAEIDVPDRLRRTPLHLATQYGGAAVRMLVRWGADVWVKDKYGRTPLHLAARYDEAAVEILLGVGDNILEPGVDVGAADKYGRTALHMAAQYSRMRTYESLVRRGASVGARDLFGRTSMYWVEKERGGQIPNL